MQKWSLLPMFTGNFWGRQGRNFNPHFIVEGNLHLEYFYWKESQPSLKASFPDSCFTGFSTSADGVYGLGFHFQASLTLADDLGIWAQAEVEGPDMLWAAHPLLLQFSGPSWCTSYPGIVIYPRDKAQGTSIIWRSSQKIRSLCTQPKWLFRWLGQHIGVRTGNPQERDHQVEGPSECSHATDLTVYICPHCGFDHSTSVFDINFGNFFF